MFHALRKSTPMLVILLLLGLIMLVAVILIMMGYTSLAIAVSNLGTVIVLIGALLYIVVFDSKKRWPNDTARQRLVKVLTFSR